jgi:hypothetical protein
MGFWIGVNVTTIEIDAIGIHSVMPSRHAIRIEDGKQIEYEFFPQ